MNKRILSALGLFLLLQQVEAQQRKNDPCLTEKFRSPQSRLSHIDAVKALPQVEETINTDPRSWTSKNKIESILSANRAPSGFNAQLLLLVDCNGQIRSASILSTSDETLTKKLIPSLQGTSVGSIARKSGQPVSCYVLTSLLYTAGQLQQNPIFSNQ